MAEAPKQPKPLGVGIHDIPAERYHADPCETPSLTRSIAHTILSQSLMHAWHQHPALNPNYRPRHESRFDIGSAAHAILFGGYEKLCIVNANDWRTLDAKAARHSARANNLTPVLKKDEISIRKMADVCHEAIADSELKGVFDDGWVERVLIWKESGVLCRVMVDWINPKMEMVVDYKTTADSEPERWSRGHIRQLGYDLQQDFYSRAVLEHYGIDPYTQKTTFVFIVQEVRPPYAVSFVSLNEQYKLLAHDRMDRALALWSECLADDKWPGYPKRVAYAEPPKWEIAEEEYRVEQESIA